MYTVKSIDKILLSRLEFGIDAYKLSRQFYRTENRITNDMHIHIQHMHIIMFN